MRSWTAPEPPPPRRSRFLFLAFVVWCGALYLGNRLAWPEGYSFFGHVAPETQESANLDVQKLPESQPSPLPELATRDTEVAPDVADKGKESAQKTSARTGELPPCEAFLEEAKHGGNERMPTHLGRSAMIEFVGSAEWAKPCRGRKRRTMQFCAAIRDGVIVGLTLRGRPHDLSLETCVREQATKLLLPQEPAIRIVDAILTI
jgi:hypothetical protein